MTGPFPAVPCFTATPPPVPQSSAAAVLATTSYSFNSEEGVNQTRFIFSDVDETEGGAEQWR